MKFAAIADVHGNCDALEAVLADIRMLGIRDVVNFGDHVSGPLEAARTADRLMALDLATIRGDQDRRLVEAYDNGQGSSERGDFLELSPHHFAWMASQPETLRYRGEVFLCHGSPRDDACYWLDRVAPDGNIVPRQLAEIEAEAAGIDASLILCAHTHLPRALQLSDGRLAVNPGSVGLPGYEGRSPVPHVVQTGTPAACYAILERTQVGWSVTFRHVPYDPEPMAELALQRGWPLWAKAISTGWCG